MEFDKVEMVSVDYFWKKIKYLELRGFYYFMCFLLKNVGNFKK